MRIEAHSAHHDAKQTSMRPTIATRMLCVFYCAFLLLSIVADPNAERAKQATALVTEARTIFNEEKDALSFGGAKLAAAKLRQALGLVDSPRAAWAAAARDLGLVLMFAANASLVSSMAVDANGEVTLASTADMLDDGALSFERATAIRAALDEALPHLQLAAAFDVSGALAILRRAVEISQLCSQFAGGQREGAAPQAFVAYSDGKAPAAKKHNCGEALPQPPPNTAVALYSYHDARYGTDGQLISGERENKLQVPRWLAMASASARSLRDTHPHLLAKGGGLVIQLASNVEATCKIDTPRIFDQHRFINLQEAAKLPLPSEKQKQESGERNAMRILCATKIAAIIAAFDQGFAKAVYLDHDTMSLRPWLAVHLGALEDYDVAGTMEGYHHGGYPPNGGNIVKGLTSGDKFELRYELNTGVLGVRKRARRLLVLWLKEFRQHADAYAKLSSADQPALMKVLRDTKEFRFFPLPPALNFRPYTVYSHTGPAVPGVVHDLRLALGPGKLKDIRESNLAMIDQTLKTPWPEVEQDAGRAFGM